MLLLDSFRLIRIPDGHDADDKVISSHRSWLGLDLCHDAEKVLEVAQGRDQGGLERAADSYPADIALGTQGEHEQGDPLETVVDAAPSADLLEQRPSGGLAHVLGRVARRTRRHLGRMQGRRRRAGEQGERKAWRVAAVVAPADVGVDIGIGEEAVEHVARRRDEAVRNLRRDSHRMAGQSQMRWNRLAQEMCDSRDAADLGDGARGGKVDAALEGPDGGATEDALASSSRRMSPLDDTELEPVGLFAEPDGHGGKAGYPERVDRRVLAIGRDATERQDELLLTKGGKRQQRLQEPAHRSRERARVGDVTALDASGDKDDARPRE